MNLSYNRDKNNNSNFFVKICNMDTKLNMWQTRDLTLFGRAGCALIFLFLLSFFSLLYFVVVVVIVAV